MYSNKYHFQHIDIIKGFAIILVVLGHIIQFSLINGGGQHAVYQWIYQFHMQVFFFVSGFLLSGFSLKETVMYNVSKFTGKLMRICLPYITWSLLICLFDSRFSDLFCVIDYIRVPRFGLWYLKDLFKYSMVLMAFIAVLDWIDTKLSRFHVPIIALSGIIIISVCLLEDRYLSMMSLGYLVRKNQNIQDILVNKYIATLAATIFVLSTYYGINKFIIGLCAVIVFWNISINMGESKIKVQLARFGQSSMAIFLLHYFLVIPVRFSIINIGPMPMFVVVSFLSILVSYVCVLLYSVSKIGYLPLPLWGERCK